jgi:hypothetical protein
VGKNELLACWASLTEAQRNDHTTDFGRLKRVAK